MGASHLIRRHESGGTASEAVYSSCETYRYALTRSWDPAAPRLAFVMLNPSTADELRNDPTVERCERRARTLGFGSFRVVNIFAFRATAPSDLKKADQPEGPDNAAVLTEACEWADQVIAAWGAHGSHRDQDRKAKALMAKTTTDVFHLGLTKSGQPRHPLYVPYAQQPARWKP